MNKSTHHPTNKMINETKIRKGTTGQSNDNTRTSGRLNEPNTRQQLPKTKHGISRFVLPAFIIASAAAMTFPPSAYAQQTTGNTTIHERNNGPNNDYIMRHRHNHRFNDRNFGLNFRMGFPSYYVYGDCFKEPVGRHRVRLADGRIRWRTTWATVCDGNDALHPGISIYGGY